MQGLKKIKKRRDIISVKGVESVKSGITRTGRTALTAVALLVLNTTVFASPVELSLQHSIDMALSNNPAIKMAAADQAKSEGSLSEAESARMPTVTLGTSYNLRDSMTGTSGNDMNNSLRVGWQLYSGGRVEAQVDQARSSVTAAAAGIKKAQDQIRLEAASAYFSVLQTKNMVNVNKETVANLEEHLRSVQAKYDAGVVAKSDVLRSEVEVANARQNLTKAANSYELAKAGLLNTMVMAADTDVVLTDSLQYQKYETSLADCLALAEKNRPEIKQAQLSVAVARRGVDIAASGRLPSVSLSAGNNWNDGVLPAGDNWSVGISASWNLFDAGAAGSRVKQAGSSLDKAVEQGNQVKDGVLLEVRQNYLSLQEAEQRIDTSAVAEGKAQEDLYIAREKYIAGVGTNLDVIDAQLALTQAQTNRIQALYDYNISRAKLEKSVSANAE